MYLTWIGVDQQTAINIKKTDFRIKPNAFECINKDGGISVYPINNGEEEFLEFIEKYSQSKECGVFFNKDQKDIYGNDIYLLRNAKATKNIQVSEVSSTMYRFHTATIKLPKNNRFYNMIITYSSVKKSGGFYRLYCYEQEHGEIEIKRNASFIEDIVNRVAYENFSNKYYVGGYLQEYRKWRKYFYGI